MEILTQLHFIRPWWFIALIPLLIVIILLRISLVRRNNWHKVCDPHLLPHLLVGKAKKSSYWPLLWLSLLWLLMVFTLAGPSWKKLPVPVFQNQSANMIIFDLSYQTDANDLPPTRLVHSRYKLLDLLKHVKEGRYGMVVFAGEAYTVSPLTDDPKTLAAMVPQLSPDIMPVDGNNLVAAYNLAKKLFQQAGAKKGNIFVFTSNNATPKAIATAKQMAALGYKSFVLGMGTEKGAPILLPSGRYLQDAEGNIMIAKLDINSLKQLAQTGNGIYQGFTNNDTDIKYLLMAAKDFQNIKATKQDKKQITSLWQDEGRWFVFLLLPLLLLAFRRGWLGDLLP